MRGKGNRVIGLSIGSRKIAVAEIHMELTGAIAVDRLEVADVPSGSIENGKIINSVAVSRVIGSLLSESDIRNKEVSLSIPGDTSIMRLQEIPSMSRSEALNTLRGEVENFPIFTGDLPRLDYQIVSRKTEGTAQNLVVLLVAVSGETIVSYESTVEMVNRKLLAAEIAPLSVLRTILHVLERGEAQVEEGERTDASRMLVVIEEIRGTVVIFRHDIIQFIHPIEVGSSSLDNEDVFEELVTELRASISFYQTNIQSDGEIDGIIPFIDKPDSSDFADRLGLSLNMPVIRLQSEEMNSTIAEYSAIGAAVRMTTSKGDRIINLVPTPEPEIAGLRKQIGLLFLILISVAGIFILGDFLLKASTDSIKKDIAKTKQLQKDIDFQMSDEIMRLQQQLNKLKQQAATTRNAVGATRRTNSTAVVEELSRIIPKTVWLTNFVCKDNGEATFDGYALSYEAVFKFRDILLVSPYFGSARLSFVERTDFEDNKVLNFQIVSAVKTTDLAAGVFDEGGNISGERISKSK